MSESSEKVKKWRKSVKRKLIDLFGGKCCICAYDKCAEALEFHHLDPTQKDSSWSDFRRNPKKFEKIIEELEKCVMVCSNCHKEVHSGQSKVPDAATRITKQSVGDVSKNVGSYEPCPICGKMKRISNYTCSYSCAAKVPRKVDWSTIDLDDLLKTKSIMEIADLLTVTDTSVRKRMKKLKIHPYK